MLMSKNKEHFYQDYFMELGRENRTIELRH